MIHLPIGAVNGHGSTPAIRDRCLLACPLEPPERAGLAAFVRHSLLDFTELGRRIARSRRNRG